jgi:uroporphyrinogen-III decarboxylase
MWCLREFGDLVTDVALEPDKVEALADIVFGFEEELMTELPQRGFDGVAFFDDWGTQKNLIVSPKTWRARFKPRYGHQFDLAHRLGLHVYFHSCGQISTIIPDLIEAGVDILNISQPNLYDIPELARMYRDKVCFILPVSYQTTSLSGTRAEIFADVQLIMDSFDPRNGGLIGYVEEYHSMGMSQANYEACIEAFQVLGGYRQAQQAAHS